MSKYYRKQVNGKRFCATSEEELDKKIRTYLKTLEPSAEIDRGEMTITDYTLEWYDKIEKDVAHSTYDFYGYAAKQIMFRIGDKRINEITPAMLENCVRDFAHTLLKDGVNYPSQKYINSLITVLKLICNQAANELILPRNYAENLKIKSISTKTNTKHRALTDKEINQILNFEHKMRYFSLFMMLCGLMSEETVALTWGDITYDAKSNAYFVTVNKTAELISGRSVIIRPGTTKTVARKRTIPIPEPLSIWIRQNRKYHSKNELIFKNKYGQAISYSSLRKRWASYIKALNKNYNNKSNEMKRITPYDLRHTYATLLAQIDTPIRKTTALMGHAESSTTDRFYIDIEKIKTTSDIEKLSKEISRIKKTEYK